MRVIDLIILIFIVLFTTSVSLFVLAFKTKFNMYMAFCTLMMFLSSFYVFKRKVEFEKRATAIYLFAATLLLIIGGIIYKFELIPINFNWENLFMCVGLSIAFLGIALRNIVPVLRCFYLTKKGIIDEPFSKMGIVIGLIILIVGIVFLLSVIIGYKRGLVKIIASLLATLVCIVLVFLISPSVSKWIQESTPLKETVKNKCIELLLPDETTGDEVLQTELPREEQISLIEGADMPDVIRKMLLENNNSEVYTALGVQTFGEYIGAYVAKVIADILAFLITFVAVFIIVRVALGMLNILDKIPLVGGANHLVGGILGAGIGILIIWILFIVITLLYNTSLGVACMKGISESEILTKLYDSNILLKYITKF